MASATRSVADSDTPLVCRLNTAGEIVCEPVPDTSTISGEAAALLEAAITKVLPGAEWGPERTHLAIGLIEAIAKAPLANDQIPRRAGQCVGAVQDLLREEAPSLLCFNYSTQPGDVLGAWYLNTAQLVRMQRVLQQFEKTVAP
jgi:hypothetical protein